MGAPGIEEGLLAWATRRTAVTSAITVQDNLIKMSHVEGTPTRPNSEVSRIFREKATERGRRVLCFPRIRRPSQLLAHYSTARTQKQPISDERAGADARFLRPRDGAFFPLSINKGERLIIFMDVTADSSFG